LLNDLFPGTQFRQYKLLEQIGAGGIGVVWSAFDQTQNRVVALKLYKIDEYYQVGNVFLPDIHISSLHHPHVLQTYDSGAWLDIQYIVTPFIPGGSLEDRIRDKNPLLLQDALQFAAEIASALDYLHGEHVIHRDLKPSNILINFNRQLYVADFDLARVLNKTTQAMHTGRGTPAYSPPEQHTMAAITPQSDIYSFGIMLYEMFTMKLPWNNEKSLGIQQLSSDVEIPDPRELNSSLPVGLVDVLRKMTAVKSEDRPASAEEAMQMLYSCFGMEPAIISNEPYQSEASTQVFDATEFIRHDIIQWKLGAESAILNLTKFAFIELNYRTADSDLPPSILRFLLNNALIFGYQDDYWWNKLTDPAERLSIANKLINNYGEVVAERVIDHIWVDHEVHALKKAVSNHLPTSLLELARKTENEVLREKILTLLRLLFPAAKKWRETAFSAQDDLNLALLAIQETSAGDEAAMLIGHLHSSSAAVAVLKTADVDRRMPAFLAIQTVAGSLPTTIPISLRLIVTGKWLQKLLTARPLSLLLVFTMAFLGTVLGASIHIYLTYRLPNFLDMERIIISLERGAFIGVIFGLGILITRLIAERLTAMEVMPRVILSTITGGLVFSIGLFTYDVLILKNAPNGTLMTTGCLLIALGYALGPLFHSRLARIAVSFLFIFSAIAGTWWVHTSLSAIPTRLSPVFFYDYSWTNAQVLGVVLLVALSMAIPGNLFDLSLDEI
jgi:serine/threonine protein kinase